MASLNTLRTKFGIVLSIIIALALLAFILSLRDEVGFSSKDPKIGVIGGDKIAYSEYMDQYEQIKGQSGAQESTEEQAAELASATWQALVAEHVLIPGFDKLGLRVTAPERIAMAAGEVPTQAFYNVFGDPRTGAYDKAAVADFLARAENDPQAAAGWRQLNEQARVEREAAKYIALISGGVYVTSLEVARSVKAANETFEGRWAGKRYAEVPDSLVTVSGKEIKAFYNSHKNAFRQLPSRTISYVVFDVTPTDDDMLALEKSVTAVGEEFAATNELKSFIRNNRNGRIADNYLTAAQLPDDESKALMSGIMYGPELKNNEWRMARVMDSKMLPDSLGIRHIVLSYSQDALADSLLTAIRSGADFAQLAAQHSLYQATAAMGGEVGMMPFSAFTGEFVAALASAKQGETVKIAAGEAIQLMQVYKIGKIVKQMQVASITYPVEASPATVRDIYAQAGTFALNAKGSLEAFNEAASAAAVTPRIASISQGERIVRNLEDSREIARWIYSAKKGDLSAVIKANGDYVVAMLTDIDDNYFAPIEKVTTQIRAQVLRDKKYDYIMRELSGSTLAEQASSLSSEITEFKNVVYSSFYIDALGVEPRLVGAITSTTQKGVVSAPVKGLSGLYVFEVDNIMVDEKKTTETERARMQSGAEELFQRNVLPAIQQMAKIEDLRGKYF